MKTRITSLLGLDHPIVQAGMSWASSSPSLPAAVSNAGGLGVLAAGPLYVEDFTRHLDEMRRLTSRPFAVNIPLYRPKADEILDVMAQRRVPVVIASQGGPRQHLQRFKDLGATWIHVVASVEHAVKAQAAGVDALIVVGAEAGGHPPAHEVSTLVTVRQVLREVSVPVIAGGGVADGWGIAALLALGADAVQLGTRFLMTNEAAVHDNYKQAVARAEASDAVLVGRRSLPIRAIRNSFTRSVFEAEGAGVDQAEYDAVFKKSTLKQAALEGDADWGKLEAGQSAGLVSRVEPAGDVMRQLVEELDEAIERLHGMRADTRVAA